MSSQPDEVRLTVDDAMSISKSLCDAGEKISDTFNRVIDAGAMVNRAFDQAICVKQTLTDAGAKLNQVVGEAEAVLNGLSDALEKLNRVLEEGLRQADKP